MDIQELLQNLHDELNIKIGNKLVRTEVECLKKQIQDCITSINDIRTDPEEHNKNIKRHRIVMKVMFPYITYLHSIVQDIDLDLEFSKDFITAILEKHLQTLDNK
jgi:hypothetical protein